MLRRPIVLLAASSLIITGFSTAPSWAVADPGADPVVGELQRIAVDLDDGSDILLLVVVPDEGDAVRVDEHTELDDVPSGSEVEVEVGTITAANQNAVGDGGAEVVDVEVLDAPELAGNADTAIAESASISELTTTQRSVHVRTGRIGSQSADSVTPSTIASDVTSNVAPYWSSSTDGVIRFSVASHSTADAYGSWGSTSTCTTTQILDLMSWTASSVGIDVGDGAHALLYTPRFSACGFAGVAHVADGGVAWVNGSPSQRWPVIAHELGHNLTLAHSNSRIDCSNGRAADGTSSTCQNSEYGDAYDVMGTSTGGTGPLSGAQLDALGLLTSSSAVQASGPMTATLAPVGAASGTRFLTFMSGTARYYVEYRGAVGRDADLASTRRGCPAGVASCTLTRYTPGVVVRRVDSTSTGTYLLDAGVSDPAHSSSDPWFVLPAGRSFVTSDGRYTVRVRSTSSAGATVEILQGSQPSSDSPAPSSPSVATLPPGLSMSGPAAVTFGHRTELSIGWRSGSAAVTGRVNLQRLQYGRWVHIRQVAVVNGRATTVITPGSTNSYRLRASSANSPRGVSTSHPVGTSNTYSVVVHRASNLPAVTLSGLARVRFAQRTTLSITWHSSNGPVTGRVNLQRLQYGRWVHIRQIAVVNGRATTVITPGSTNSYRLRASRVSSPSGVTTSHPRGTSNTHRVTVYR